VMVVPTVVEPDVTSGYAARLPVGTTAAELSPLSPELTIIPKPVWRVDATLSSCGVFDPFGAGGPFSFNDVQREEAQFTQDSVTQVRGESAVENAEDCPNVFASSARIVGALPLWPIVTTMLGLLIFAGSCAFILAARRRRSEEVFDFQI